MSNISNQLNPVRWKLFKANSNFGSNKIFLAKQIQNVRTNDLFPQIYLPPTAVQSNLVNEIRITNDLNEADYILVPHDWVNIYKNQSYVRYLQELSKDTPLLMLNMGDVSPKLKTKNTVELRTFLHPWENLDRKIIIPYPAKLKPYKIRRWTPIPTISFMGYVPGLSLGTLTSKHVQAIKHPIKSSVYINRKIGLLRVRLLKSKVKTQIVERSNFTAYLKNPNLLTDIEAYEESLQNSDYVLCPRGFGNTSIRFYEVISAGRIPLLINSYSGLPALNQNYRWQDHIVQVNLFSNWASQIAVDWNYLGIKNNYEKRQTDNYELFTNILEFNSYLFKLFQYYIGNK